RRRHTRSTRDWSSDVLLFRSALIGQGHQVRVLDAVVPQVHANNRPEFLNPKAEFLRGDICDRAQVQKALDGVSVIVHQAAEVGEIGRASCRERVWKWEGARGW